MISVLEDSFRNVIAKMFGTDENYDVIINPEKGDFEIWRNRTVVADDELEDENLQLTLTEARKIDADCEVGEEVTDEVHFADFGRRAILNLRQTLASKILELQKDSLFAKYKDKIGNIIAADVYQVWKKEILLLDDEGNELLLPKTEQIPTDFTVKVKPCVLSYSGWITTTTIRRSSFPVQTNCSCSVCSNLKFRKSTMV